MRTGLDALANLLVCVFAATFLVLGTAWLHGGIQEPYDRDLYRHWTDADGDCMDARQEVLAAESITPVEIEGCRVVAGRWFDAFTGQTFVDPGRLDVDHLVPLAEAHRSGADVWDAERREAYANDLTSPLTLIAVSASANRSKGSRDPAEWLPPNQGYRCQYVRQWTLVKARWGLTMDAEESRVVQETLQTCG